MKSTREELKGKEIQRDKSYKELRDTKDIEFLMDDE